MNEQTALEADAQVTPEIEAPGEPDLESLLSEGRQAQAEQAQSTKPVEKVDIDKEKLDAVYKYVETQTHKEAQSETDVALKGLVTAIKGENDVSLSDDALSQQFLGYASQNPLFGQAFDQRHTNPKAWDVAQKEAVKSVGAALKGGPSQSTNDKEAAMAAVRNTSGAAPVTDDETKYDGQKGAALQRLREQTIAKNAAARKG